MVNVYGVIKEGRVNIPYEQYDVEVINALENVFWFPYDKTKVSNN